MKTILRDPNPLLRKKSTKITDFHEARQIAEKLIETTKGVDKPWNFFLGMAAPQIGYNKRVIILRKSYKRYQVIINPEITEKKWKSFLPLPTRCFSLPGVYLVKDHLWLKIKYRDPKGKIYTEILKGGRARVFQQEINHIDGILLSDIGIRII